MAVAPPILFRLVHAKGAEGKLLPGRAIPTNGYSRFPRRIVGVRFRFFRLPCRFQDEECQPLNQPRQIARPAASS